MDRELETIRNRRSARVPFDPDRPVAEEDLMKILEAARWAPTPHNMQNFEVVVVDDPEVIAELGRIESRVTETFLRENYEQLSPSEEELRRRKTGIMASSFPRAWLDPSRFREVAKEGKPRSLSRTIDGSPLLLVIVYDPGRRAPDSEGDVLGLISLGCVMENMWLEATALGISVRLLSDFGDQGVEEEAKRVLGVPKRLRLAYGLRLGYPVSDSQDDLRVRRDIADIMYHNRYGERGLE